MATSVGARSKVVFSKELERFDRDVKWVKQHESELRREYTNQFVAIFNQRVIDADKDEKALRARLDPTRGQYIKYFNGEG